MFLIVLCCSADHADLQHGRQPGEQRRGQWEPADEAAPGSALHRHANPVVRHLGERPSAADHPVLQTVQPDGRHRAHRPGLLLPGHGPEAAAAPNSPAVRQIPRAAHLCDRGGQPAAGPGGVRGVPGAPPQRPSIKDRPDHTGASVHLWFLGEEEGEHLFKLQSAARTLTGAEGLWRVSGATLWFFVYRHRWYIWYFYRFTSGL